MKFLLLASITLMVTPTFAQNLTVQQPVVRQFGVSTTVSVPDRGSALLGGVNSARDFGSSRGFGPFNNRVFGGDRSAASVSTHVYIHDFAAMDAYLLGQASGHTDDPRSVAIDPTSQLRGFGRHLLANRRDFASHSPRRVSAGRQVTSPSQPPTPSPTAKAARFWKLGLAAERKGKPNVAKIHFRMAAKYGSELAAAKLQNPDGEPLAQNERASGGR